MSAHLRAERLMTESIDFGLTPAEQAEVGDHLTTCAMCRARNLAYRSDAADLRHFAFVEPPARVRWSIIEGVEGRRSRSFQPWQVLVAATLVLVSIFAAAAAMGALDSRRQLGVAPTDPPSTSALALPRASTSPAAGLPVRCGPLQADQLRCLQLVAASAAGLSTEYQAETITAVSVQAGSTRVWCAPPQPCVSAPPDSYWVLFNSRLGTETLPVYGDGGGGWLLGVPVAEEAPSDKNGPTTSPSAN